VYSPEAPLFFFLMDDETELLLSVMHFIIVYFLHDEIEQENKRPSDQLKQQAKALIQLRLTTTKTKITQNVEFEGYLANSYGDLLFFLQKVTSSSSFKRFLLSFLPSFVFSFPVLLCFPDYLSFIVSHDVKIAACLF
jgi:hypothetical protein